MRPVRQAHPRPTIRAGARYVSRSWAYFRLSADEAVLELYAIEIQMYSDLKESKKLKVRFR